MRWMRVGSFTVAGLALVSLALAGCMPMAPVYVSQLKVAPPVLMVAKKSNQPLYIVLDPAKVPDQVVIPGGELKPLDVYEMQTFVRRDLKNAMAAFFKTVEVVGPDFVPPSRPCWVADVRIDSVAMAVNKASDTNAQYIAAQVFGQITWAFAMRPAKADDYAYSFADTSVGTYSLTSVSETGKMFESAFEVAITTMVKGLIEKGVDKRLTGVTSGSFGKT